MPLRVLSSLKSRLALAGALLIAASVLIGATGALNLVDLHINDALLDSEAAQARTLARVASNRLVARQAILRLLSQDLPPLAERATVLDWLRGKTVLLSSFDSLFVTTPSGEGVALANADGVRANSMSVADRPYFQRTLQQRTPQISDPVASRVTGLPTIIFTQPVLGADGSLRAVLGASLRLSSRDLLVDLTDDDRSDESGHVTAIIDREGRLIAHADPALILQPAERDAHLAVAIATWRANGAPFAIQGQSWRSDGHYVGLAGIPAAEWFVVRAIDEERVLGGVALARRRAIALMLATALLGGAALWAATYWLMRPFDRLKRRAATMSVLDGEGADEPWPSGRGEIGSLAAVLREVEQRNRASVQERAQLLRQMHSVLEHAAVGLLVTIDRKMVLVSGALCRLFGYEEDELTGQPARLLFASDEVYDALGPQVAQAFAEQGQFDAELPFVKRDGSMMWGRLVGRPVAPHNPAAGTIWVIDDVSVLREQRERLEWASTHDSLTGLANRAAFERALDRQLADRRAASGRPFCVMALDLDYFKAVNDRGGHAAGDALLQDLSSLMAKRLRRSDMLARLGGDEFGALLVNCDEPTALKVAESMREQVAQYHLRWQGEDYGVGISIGVVEVDARYADRAAAMAAADEACYDAKGAGRNQVRPAARA
jgi:diguanylate cyclase (GGDEF)-like protein/PAS domain S-box-containing protein